MLPLHTFVTPPQSCSYLQDRESQMRYDIMLTLSQDEYQQRLDSGWRRFGHALFRPVCSNCKSCQSLRVDVNRFQPNQSQRRAWKANPDLVLTIGKPGVTEEKIALYDRFHSFQSGAKGWPEHDPENPVNYATSFVDNPFETQEWCYRLDDRLVGVGYVDQIPTGLSAIYFYHDPEFRDRSLGTFNVLSVIDRARQKKLPHVYLGYYVEGCRSLEYKARFKPNEVLDGDQKWVPFQQS